MTEPKSPGAAPLFSKFALDYDIRAGDVVLLPAGTEIQVRRPGSGELRNVNITALISQCAYSEIETLAPRITTPSLSKQHVAAMDPADLVQLGGEMIDFLVPKAARPEAFPSA